MPHFSSKRMGDAIRKLAQENPGKEIVVLCGHTHGEGVCHPEPGVVCYTGKAEYRYPRVGNSFLVK
jgi:methionine aminopeptidase